jgi:hypothetical protein
MANITIDALKKFKDMLTNSKKDNFKIDVLKVSKYGRGGYSTELDRLMTNGGTGVKEKVDYLQKFDATTDNVSDQTSGNFAQGVLPRGVESVLVGLEELDSLPGEFKELLQPTLNSLSDALQRVLNNCGFRQMVKECARDFIDYGNAICEMFYDRLGQVQVRKMPFEYAYFQSYARLSTVCVLHECTEPECIVKAMYTEYELANDKMFANREVTLYYIFADDYMNAMLISYMTQTEFKSLTDKFKDRLQGSSYYIYVLNDKLEVIDYSSTDYKPFYYATTDSIAGNGYGRGSGISTLGSTMEANIAGGSRIVTSQKIQSPANMTASQIVLRPQDANYANLNMIDPRAGAITKVSEGEGENAPLRSPFDACVRQVGDPGRQLSEFITMGQNASVAIKEGYQTSAYLPGEPAPGESIPMTISRLAMSIRSFRSKSDNFCDDIVIPVCETILYTLDIQGYINNVLAQLGEYAEGLKLTPKIVLDSTLHEQEYNVKKTNFERKIAAIGGVMNFRTEEEGGGETFQELISEIHDIYKN